MDERLNIKVLLDTSQFKSEIASMRASIISLGRSLQTISSQNNALKDLTNIVRGLSSQFGSINTAGIERLLSEIDRLSGTINRITPEIRRSAKATKEWDDTALKTWASTRGWRQSFTELGSAFRGLWDAFEDSIILTREFDDAIRAASAVTGDFDNAMSEFTDAAKEMGRTTVFTAVEAAGALQMLAMAGLNVEKSVGALPSVLNLAQAAGVSLADSADIVTNVMAQYGIETKDLGRATDVLVGTFTRSNTSLKELAKAFVYGGSIAKATNQSFEQTNALLGVLANAGYKSGKAGRTLSNTLVRLAQDTPKVSAIMAKYGVQLQDVNRQHGDNEKQIRPLVDIINDLNRKMGDMSKGVGDAGKIIDTFGLVAGPGLTSLMAQGADSIKKLEASFYGLTRVEADKIIGELYQFTEASFRGEKATSTFAEKLAKFNVNVIDSYKNLKSIPGILTDLANAGVQASEIQNIFGDLENIRQIETAYNLVKDSAKAGQVSITDMQRELAKTGGVSSTVAGQMSGGIGGSIRLLISAFEDLKLTISGAFRQEVTDQINRLIGSIQENKKVIVSYMKSIFSVIVTMMDWAITIGTFMSKNEALMTVMLGTIVVIKILKSQVFELAAVIFAKMVVALLTATGTLVNFRVALSLTIGFLKLVKTQLIAFIAVHNAANWSALVASIKGLGVAFAFVTASLGPAIAVLAGFAAIVEGVSWAVFGQSFITSIGEMVSAMNVFEGKGRDLRETLDDVSMSVSAVEESRPKNFGDMDITSLQNYRNELQNIVSTLEGMQLADPESISPEQLDTLKKYKEEYKQLNKEFFSEKRQQEIEALKTTRNIQGELGESAKKASSDISMLTGVYDRFYDSLRKTVDLKAGDSIAKINENLKMLEISLSGANEAGMQQLLTAQRDAALQIIAIEEQRVEKALALYDQQYQKKGEIVLNNIEDEDAQAQQLLQIEAESIAKRIELQEGLRSTIAQNLDNAISQYQQYTNKVVELDRAIESEKRRQSDVLRELEYEGLSEARLLTAKKNELSKKRFDFNSALSEGDLQRAIEIAKEEERLALEVGKARQEAGERGVKEDTVSAVESAQRRINEAMQKQREIAEQNRVAQEEQVKALQSALTKINELLIGTKEAGGLLEQQIKLNVDIIGQDVVEAKIESLSTELEKPIEKKLIILPEGKGINDFLNNLKAQIDKLKTTGAGFATGKLPGVLNAFATGGLVQGRGTGTSDSILARVSRGEAIIPAKVVNSFGNRFFEDLIRGNLAVPAFAGGGIIGEGSSNNSTPQQSMQPININLGSKKIPLYAKADQTKQVLLGLQELLR